MKQVLFICTGNFYRSRLSEALFNHGAEARNLPWKSFSRGLDIEQASGHISHHTRQTLDRLKIDLKYTAPTRQSLTMEDLERAERIFAMDVIEHRPYMENQFPDWLDRITYWECRDVLWEEPDSCIRKIQSNIQALLREITESERLTA